jgi:haloalkane dehalogenase
MSIPVQRAIQVSDVAPGRGELSALFPALKYGRFLTLASSRLHYIDAGEGDPIVCVHGNPTWSFYWRGIIEGFRATNRVIALDHVGCGLSDKPQEFDYCLSQHTENLIRLIEHLDLSNITLVVHDWGGAIGAGAAVRLPKRFARLVFTNTGCFPPPFVPWRIRACRLPLLGTAMIRGLNLFARSAVWMATTRRGGLSTEARTGLLAPYDSWHNRVAIDRFVRDIPLNKRHRTWQTLAELESRLKELADKPCLMMWGMRDWCFRPECLRRMQQHFPHAETIELASAGHYVMEDAPADVVAGLAAFIGSSTHRATRMEA